MFHVAVCHFVLTTVAVAIGNALLWVTICGTRSLRSSSSHCLGLCLSAADLLVGTVNVPGIVVLLITRRNKSTISGLGLLVEVNAVTMNRGNLQLANVQGRHQ